MMGYAMRPLMSMNKLGYDGEPYFFKNIVKIFVDK